MVKPIPWNNTIFPPYVGHKPHPHVLLKSSQNIRNIGGKKSRRRRPKSHARKTHKKRSHSRRRRHRGGGAGIMSVLNKAIVPFSLYKLQKRMQRMTRKAHKHFSSRRRK